MPVDDTMYKLGKQITLYTNKSAFAHMSAQELRQGYIFYSPKKLMAAITEAGE